MHWISAGMIIYSFAAPSSVASVPYAFAQSGLVLGGLISLVCIAASAQGALLLLRVHLEHGGNGTMLSDVTRSALGPTGERWVFVVPVLA